MNYTVVLALVAFSSSAAAADYRCTVDRKVSATRDYTAAELKRSQFSNLVEDTAEGTFLSRCSFSLIQKRITCDRYRVDHIEVDAVVRIKKLYVFNSQFNLQIFRDLSFVEDNGRGDISFGRCELTAP